jgi:hypothetical protein
VIVRLSEGCEFYHDKFDSMRSSQDSAAVGGIG